MCLISLWTIGTQRYEEQEIRGQAKNDVYFHYQISSLKKDIWNMITMCYGKKQNKPNIHKAKRQRTNLCLHTVMCGHTSEVRDIATNQWNQQ